MSVKEAKLETPLIKAFLLTKPEAVTQEKLSWLLVGNVLRMDSKPAKQIILTCRPDHTDAWHAYSHN